MPIKVGRDPNEEDGQPDEGLKRLGGDGVTENGQIDQNEEDRDKRIALDLVGTGKVRLLAAEDNDREPRGGEKNNEGEDDVFVEGLVFPGKAKEAGPYGLADQGLAGNPVTGMDIGHAPEETRSSAMAI